MTKVVPAVEELDAGAFRQRVAQVRQLTDRMQMDVVDGEFADIKTVFPQDVVPPSGLKLDIHLMVARPMEFVSSCIKLRPYTIIVQYESGDGLESIIDRIADNGIRAGLAINPDTPVAEIAPLLGRISHVLVMAYPAGAPGGKLQPKVLSKVTELRDLKDSLEVSLDGGVNAETAKKIAKAGFDVVYTNTYLFSGESLLTRYHELIEAFS